MTAYYVTLIMYKKKTLDQVIPAYKKDVEDELKVLGLDGNGNKLEA